MGNDDLTAHQRHTHQSSSPFLSRPNSQPFYQFETTNLNDERILECKVLVKFQKKHTYILAAYSSACQALNEKDKAK